MSIYRALFAGLLTIFAGEGALAAPQVSSADYGVTTEGKAVHVYTLTNSHGVSARILAE